MYKHNNNSTVMCTKACFFNYSISADISFLLGRSSYVFLFIYLHSYQYDYFGNQPYLNINIIQLLRYNGILIIEFKWNLIDSKAETNLIN